MIIVVEHESSLPPATPVVHREDVLLNIHLQPQLLERWCWAAIASAMMRYYHSKDVGQATIAESVLAISCDGYETNELVREQCNQNTKLYKVLEYANCYSHWTPGKPAFERIQFEINAGRPLCCRIEWYKGDAHYVLIKGYNALAQELFIEDSLHGPANVSYKSFPSEYKTSGGAWTETYWTKNNFINP
jgi:hypothetical protein